MEGTNIPRLAILLTTPIIHGPDASARRVDNQIINTAGGLLPADIDDLHLHLLARGRGPALPRQLVALAAGGLVAHDGEAVGQGLGDGDGGVDIA